MKPRLILRLVSLLMLIAAIVFVVIALSCPTCGSVFYIGSFKVTVRVMHWFYNSYVIVMILLFLSSFFIPKKKA